MLSAEAQGYPKAESNIYIFLLNYIVFTAVRASLVASEQGSRPNPHRDDNRDKNFRFLPTMYLVFLTTMQGTCTTIPCTPIVFTYRPLLALSVA